MFKFSSWSLIDDSLITQFFVSLQQLTTGENEAVMGLMELTCVGALDRHQTDLHDF